MQNDTGVSWYTLNGRSADFCPCSRHLYAVGCCPVSTNYGFIKAAAGSVDIRVADCAHNAAAVAGAICAAEKSGVKLIAFPELCITGYTCGDLFCQNTLLAGAETALKVF